MVTATQAALLRFECPGADTSVDERLGNAAIFRADNTSLIWSRSLSNSHN
jgi:hypothetical protein